MGRRSGRRLAARSITAAAVFTVFALVIWTKPASASVIPNLAVDLVSSGFSDTSVQATAVGPSGTGSIVLQNNPGNLVAFDVTVDASGVAFTGLSINPNLCTGSQLILQNTATPSTVRVAVTCVGGSLVTGDLVLFQFGWSGNTGTVAINSSSTLVDGTLMPVPYTVSNATVHDEVPVEQTTWSIVKALFQ